MIELIQASLLCLGVKTATTEGYVLYSVKVALFEGLLYFFYALLFPFYFLTYRVKKVQGDYLDLKEDCVNIVETLFQPLFDCLVCMSSFWGCLFLFVGGYGIEISSLFFILQLAAVNLFVGSFLEVISAYISKSKYS